MDIKHVARALEELQTVAGSFQAHPDGDQLSHISSQLGMLLDELRREQSSRHSGDQRLALHYAISDILLTETDFGQVAPQLLQTIGEYLSWACGAVWRVDAEAGLIQCQAIWHLPNPAATEFIEATSGKRFKPGEGLPGMVWLSGEATWITSLDQISSFPRLESALRAGWRGALAFPIRAGAEILGVVEFFSTEPYTPDRDLLQMLAVIGDQTGQFIKRQQVEAKLTITQLHLDFILQQMPAGVIIAEAPSGRLLLGNQQAEQIWRQPFLRSSSISDYEAWQGFHLDGRPYRAEEWPLARSITSGTVIIGEEIVLLRGDGTRGVARVNSAPIRDHSGVIVAGVVVFDDITAEHQAIEQLRRLQSISAALLKALTPGQVANVIVHQALVALDAYAGTLMLKRDEQTLEMIGATGYSSVINDRFHTIPIDSPMPVPVAIRTGQPIFLEDLSTEAQHFAGLSELVSQTGTAALAAIPLHVEDRIIGAIGLSFRQPRAFEAEDRGFMLTLAGQCALALERARLYSAEQAARQRAEEAQRRLAFLAAASQLLASSLDYPTTLAHVTRLALPDLADWSAVTLAEPDGSLHIVAVTHSTPEKEVLIYEYLRRYPLNPQATAGIAQVVRSGKAELFHLPLEQLAALDLPSEQKSLLQAIGLSAYICVPLRAGDQTLGAISFGAGNSRRYSGDDLALAEELGRRCGVAIQNARLYHEAQQAIRLRDDFLTMASHELRTPLTALLGMSHLLQERAAGGTLNGDRARRGVTLIARQATRLKRLIDQMFDLSRVQLDRLDLDIRPFDLSSVVRQVVEEARALLQRHTIELDCPESLPMEGDEARLEQVLQNLLHNAIKYSPDGGSIAINIVEHEQNVAITIADPGIGIPQAAQEHLFKRFYRASNGVQRNISGLGIGLYIVREIVQRHAGTIGFRSVEGQGTSFTISLPRWQPATSQEPGSSSTST